MAYECEWYQNNTIYPHITNIKRPHYIYPRGIKKEGGDTNPTLIETHTLVIEMSLDHSSF